MPPAAGFNYTPPSYLIRASDSTNRPWNNNPSKVNEQGFGEYDANGENEYDLPQEDRPQTRRESYVDAHFHQRVRTKQHRYRDIINGELEVHDDGHIGDLSSSFGTNSTLSTSCSSRRISNNSIVDLSMENNTGVVVEDDVPHKQEGQHHGNSGKEERQHQHQRQHQHGYTNLNGDNGIHHYDVEDEEEDDSVLLAAANVDCRRVQLIEQSRINTAQVVVAAKNSADSFEYARIVRSAQQPKHMSQAADNAKARSSRKERITGLVLSPTQVQRRRATFNDSSTDNTEAINAETVRSLRVHRLRSSLLKPTLNEHDNQNKLELRRLKARKEEDAADRRRAQSERETSLSSSFQTPTPSLEDNNNSDQSDNNNNNNTTTTTTTTTTNAAQQQQQQQQKEQREAFIQERKALEAERAAFTKAQAAAAAAAFQRASEINDERRKIRKREEIRKQREQEREEIREQREREYEARIETERMEEVQRTKRRNERSRERERSSEQQRKKKDKNSNSTKDTSNKNTTTQSSNHNMMPYKR